MKSQWQVLTPCWGMCQWMFPLDLVDRGIQFSPARLVLAFLEVCTKGIATTSHTNGYCLLWKVIYCGFLPLTVFPVVLPFYCKLTVGSCAILVQWFWKCLLWEAETNFHQIFSSLFWSEIHQSFVVENISVAYFWEASMWRRTRMALPVVQRQCLKAFHALKPCHWAEEKLACSEGRLGIISPEPAEWFAGKQGYVSVFLRVHTAGSVLSHG